MSYKITTVGMDDLLHTLEKAGNGAQGVAAASLYEGAGVIADAISKSAKAVHSKPFKYASTKKGQKREPSPEEVAALNAAGAAGIAKFGKNGLTVDTSVGFSRSGYAVMNFTSRRHHSTKTARTSIRMEGGGVAKPVAVIANAINSGTSFMNKQPFIRKAISQNKGAALAAIESGIEQRVEQMFK